MKMTLHGCSVRHDREDTVRLLERALIKAGYNDVRAGCIMLPNSDWHVSFTEIIREPGDEPKEQPSAFDLTHGSR